ncbi:hypothetical protein ACV3VK_06205 [Clostridium perfringens]
MRFNINAFKHYILIYLMIQYIGGRLLVRLGSDIFYGGVILICGIYLLKNKKNVLKDIKYFLWISFIGFSFLIPILYTRGGLSFATALSVISRFLIVYVAVVFDRNKFCQRFINIAVILSCVSLFIFIITSIVGFDRLNSLMSLLYTYRDGNENIVSYGTFFIVFNVMDKTRNSGIFGEPGEFQILINIALYFTIFKAKYLDNNQKLKYILLFIVTLFTVVSTTGFLNLIVLILVSIFQKNKIVSPKIKHLLYILITLSLIYVILFLNENSFLKTEFFNKFLSSSGIDFSHGTGSARIESFKLLSKVLETNPISIIFGLGFKGVFEKYTGFELACSGLISSLLMFGIIPFLIIYIYMIKLSVKTTTNIIEFIFVIFFVINNGLGQPDIMQVMSILICCYGYLSRKGGLN